ncbi:hypothetical protein [Croceibacterium aestuarii]|uniref:hypothetical protein n=1 Tax=Croceibacterium aestuarii TaxID=3064139 RepID=UPI00272E97B7|nr:hypothetical protein [Croceibacterium sp. D39]
MTEAMIVRPAPGPVNVLAWEAISSMPEDCRDGRPVLLWFDDGHPELCSWEGDWLDAVGRKVAHVTHWADVTGPGGETCLGH